MKAFLFLFGIWWLCVIPGAFLCASFEPISDWIEAKVRELIRK